MDNFESKLDINKIIEYMEGTDAKDWCTDVVRTKGEKNCFFGHLFEFAGGEKKYKDNTNCGTMLWDAFECLYATTYMIYPVNDGKDKDYQQETAKERVIAYLKDLRDGKKKTTQQLMHEYE